MNYKKNFFNYRDFGFGPDYHYMIIKRALREKLDQNDELWELLIRTDYLILRPDHEVRESDPTSYHYDKILMELRSERQFIPCRK